MAESKFGFEVEKSTRYDYDRGEETTPEAHP